MSSDICFELDNEMCINAIQNRKINNNKKNIKKWKHQTKIILNCGLCLKKS